MANSSTVPNYCSSRSLQYAKAIIKTHLKDGTQKKKCVRKDIIRTSRRLLGLYDVKAGFKGDEWLGTPERRDPNSGKRPDWTEQKLFINKDNKRAANPHVLNEFKSKTGDRFEKLFLRS